MKPSDYIPNEPERKTLHEFICATVAACVASIYPRADSRSFRRIIDNAVRGAEAAACVEEACPACREVAAERARLGYSGPCPCRHCVACRDGRIAAAEAGLFRTLSFARAELSPDDIRRAEADPSEVTVVYSDHDAKESIGAAVRQAIQTNSSGGGQSSHPDS